MIELVDPAFELQQAFGAPGAPAVVRGRDELLAWLRPDAFDEERIETLAFHERGELVLVEVRDYGRSASSGVEIEQIGFHLWRIDDGRLVRVELYYDRPAAYAAAGLLPAAADPISPPGR